MQWRCDIFGLWTETIFDKQSGQAKKRKSVNSRKMRGGNTFFSHLANRLKIFSTPATPETKGKKMKTAPQKKFITPTPQKKSDGSLGGGSGTGVARGRGVDVVLAPMLPFSSFGKGDMPPPRIPFLCSNFHWEKTWVQEQIYTKKKEGIKRKWSRRMVFRNFKQNIYHPLREWKPGYQTKITHNGWEIIYRKKIGQTISVKR